MKETVKRFIITNVDSKAQAAHQEKSSGKKEKTVRRIPKKKRYIEIYVKRGESVSVYQVKR